ncbi:MAG: hypothetical protein RI933_273 [Actinomycetota bacterium]
MNQQVRAATPKSSLREAITNAAGPVALSNQVLLLFAIPSYASIFLYNLQRSNGTIFDWFIIGSVAYLTTIGVLLIFRATVLGTDFRPSKPFVMIAALVTAGTARAISVLIIGGWLGVVPASDALFRLFSGPFFVLGAIATIAIYYASVRRNEETLAQLRREKAVLDELRGSIRERIRLQREQLVSQVERAIAPVIERFEKERNAKQSIEILRASVDEVVRPLSHAIAKPGAFPTETGTLDAVLEKVEKERQRLPKLVNVGDMLVPLFILFTMTTAGIGPLFEITPGREALAVITFTVGGWTSLKSIQALARKIWAPVWLAAVWVLVISFVVAVIIEALLIFVARSSFEQVQLWQVFSLISLGSVTSMFMQVPRTLRFASEQQLRAVVQDLEILNSELRQQVWHNQRRIASILHGSVQAAIYAGAMKIAEQAVLDPTLITKIRRDVDAAINRLHTETESTDVVEVIGQMSAVWNGVCDVRLAEYSKRAATALAGNSVAASCTIEVVREAVNNAIKHGGAKQLSIYIRLESEKLVRLVIENDGAPALDDAVAGFGSQVLDEITHQWSLKSENGLTYLVAMIPVSKISR